MCLKISTIEETDYLVFLDSEHAIIKFIAEYLQVVTHCLWFTNKNEEPKNITTIITFNNKQLTIYDFKP